ncbi:MAG TPA: hypothetical protein VL048_04765 [Xanthobacteraceae bacterium]|nr:hypothetical protein [Xanthobacteraceae bacterium]
MAFQYRSSVLRAVAALALVLVLAGCTPGGQFDPTTLLDNDMFDTKAKLRGQRVPLFPNGVPGTTTGVPADLVKGYQAPPDQNDADADAGAQSPPPAAEPAKPAAAQPQSKPKPKVTVGRPRPRAAKTEKPPSSEPTRIDIGAKGAPAQQQPGTVWPNSAPPAAQQGGQFAWPSPPGAPAQQAAQPSQSIWPAPPSTAPAPAAASPSTAPAQPAATPSTAPGAQTGSSFDSMWPKSTPNGTISQ